MSPTATRLRVAVIPCLLVVAACSAASRATGRDGVSTPDIAPGRDADAGPAAGPDGSPAGYRLAWSDEFDGAAVDPAVWQFRRDVKANSAQLPVNVSLSGGMLRIALRKEATADKAYTGGGVVSRRAFGQGYYETRARLHGGSGWHSAFWMMAGDGSDTFGPGRTIETDGFETDSVNPSVLENGFWRWNAGAVHHACRRLDVGFDASKDFHTYAVEWTADVLRFSIDGHVVCTTVHDAREHVTRDVNVWLTSIAAFHPVDEGALPGEIAFDYIRYYEPDPLARPPAEVVVDNGEPGIQEQGAWLFSALAGHLGSYSRYSTDPAAVVRWNLSVTEGGTYDLAFFRVVAGGSEPAARVEVEGAPFGARAIDFATGASGWIDLGRLSLAPSATVGVKLSRTNPASRLPLRADAVRLARAP